MGSNSRRVVTAADGWGTCQKKQQQQQLRGRPYVSCPRCRGVWVYNHKIRPDTCCETCGYHLAKDLPQRERDPQVDRIAKDF